MRILASAKERSCRQVLKGWRFAAHTAVRMSTSMSHNSPARRTVASPLGGGDPAAGQRWLRSRTWADQTKKREELENLVRDQDSKIKDLKDKEVQLLKATRELEDDKAAWDLQQERMRAEISKEEREKATKLANERAELDLRSKQQELEKEEERFRDEKHQIEVRQLKDQLDRVKNQLADAEVSKAGPVPGRRRATPGKKCSRPTWSPGSPRTASTSRRVANAALTCSKRCG